MLKWGFMNLSHQKLAETEKNKNSPPEVWACNKYIKYWIKLWHARIVLGAYTIIKICIKLHESFQSVSNLISVYIEIITNLVHSQKEQHITFPTLKKVF